MGRESYDDLTPGPSRNGRPHRGDAGNNSRRLILVVVVVGVLLCAVAVFLWLTLFPAETLSVTPVPAASVPTAAQEPVSSGAAQAAVPEEGGDVSAVPPVAPVQSEPEQKTVGDTVPAASPVAQATDATSGTTARSLDAQKKTLGNDGTSIQYADHLVAEGETLASIAEAYGLRPQTIISVNRIKNIEAIVPGGTLRIPDRDGQLYVVQEGDMLSTISRKFSPTLGWKTLQELNGLTSENIKVGQVLFIPDTTSTSVVSPTVSTTRFVQPTTGRIVGLYGQSVMEPTTGASLILDGIRIQGKIGTAVKASAAGVVVDAGYEPQGRGRFVQISHEGGYKTSYEHLESVGVKIGEQVRQGDPIGSIGTTGTEFSEPTLFFKIEQGGIALDPAGFFQ